MVLLSYPTTHSIIRQGPLVGGRRPPFPHLIFLTNCEGVTSILLMQIRRPVRGLGTVLTSRVVKGWGSEEKCSMLMEEALQAPHPHPSPSASSEGPSFKEFSSARVSEGFSEGKLEQAEACRGQQEAVTGARGRDGGRPVQLRAGAVEARGLPARPYLVLTVDLGPRVNQNLKNP